MAIEISGGGPLCCTVDATVCTLVDFSNFQREDDRPDRNNSIWNKRRDPLVLDNVGVLKSQNDNSWVTFKDETTKVERSS